MVDLLRILGAAAFATAMTGASVLQAGTVVVNADEWTLRDTGFSNAPDTGQFVSNLVAELGTSIHAYSNNAAYVQGSLGAAMSSAGATYTTGTGFAFTLANISPYDAIFLGGDYLGAAELADLSTYVSNGGNVYLSGGTGNGGPAAEAAAWNPFLAVYGIQFTSPYTGVSGVIPTSGDALFNGVSSLYFDNPNGMTGTKTVCCGNAPLFAVSRDAQPPVIPLPASGFLLAAAILAAGGVARRR